MYERLSKDRTRAPVADASLFSPVRAKRVVLVLATIVVTVALCACQFGDKDIQFTEEVQLENGEVLNVQRFIRAAPLGELGGPGGWEPTYMSFEITDPKGSENPPKWESAAGLLPILFDRDPGNGEWVLLATFYTCEPWYALGRPKLPYAEFRVRNGQWQRVDLSEKWIGRPTNVFAAVSIGGEPEFLTLAEKHRRNADDRIVPKYRSIVRQWTTGC